MKLEVLVGENLNVSAVADARNTSLQVSDIALFELDDKFNFVKDGIKNESYKDNVAFKDNENKPILVADLLRLMFAFNIKRFPDDVQPPIQAYSGKATVFKDYKNEYDKDFLQKYGFNNVEILTEKGSTFGDITLYKTPCLHGVMEKAMPYYKMFGFRPDAMGIVFKQKDEPVLYLAGDTIWCDFVKNSIDEFAPKAIIINAAAAQLKHSGPIIMGTDDVAALRRYAPDLTVIASHMDAVGHATLDRKGLKEFITANNIADDFLIPEDGEIISLDKDGKPIQK